MNTTPHFKIVSPPKYQYDVGYEGYMAFDDQYLYIYSDKVWKRAALTKMMSGSLPYILKTPTPKKNYTTYQNDHVYIYENNSWKSFGITTTETKKNRSNVYGAYNDMAQLRLVPPPTSIKAYGQDGNVSYDKEYFYMYIAGKWHKTAISIYPQPTPPII